MASDTPIDSLSDALSILVTEGFVVVDEDAEELLIRSFIKWDKGYKHPKRLMAIRSALDVVSSDLLSQVIRDELAKLGSPIDTPIDTPIGSHIDSATVPGISNVSTGGTGNREPGAGSRGASNAPPSPHCSKHPGGTDAPCRACGRARQQRENWETENAARIKAADKQWAEWARGQPNCPHGNPGGNIDRPKYGSPACALCRAERKATA